MSFEYKNPTSGVLLTGPTSVLRESDTGTNFSIDSIGGYMEVWGLSDLVWTIDPQTKIDGGDVLYSGNTIPISFIYGGDGPEPIISQLNLYNDGISSGRRRLGMLVFVQENQTTYQYHIPNYESLWNVALADGDIFEYVTGYQVLNTTAGGQAFQNAWTGSTIEGVDGVIKENARWVIADLNDTYITGGTYYSGITTLDLYNNNGGTVTITGFTGTVTGGTYNSETGTLTLNNSDSSSFDVTGFTGGGSVNVVPNTGLGVLSGNTLFTTYNTLLSPSLAMPYAVGGIPAGTTVTELSGDTFVSLFNDLLFPTVQPTYTIPTISLGGVSNTLAEVGSTISLSLTATGVKNDAGQYTQLRILRDSVAQFTDTTLTSGSTTNIPDQFGYPDPNNPNASYTISPTPYSEVYTLPAPTGLNTSTSTLYKADGDYLSGSTKQDSKGNYDVRSAQVRSSNAPQAASNNFNSTTFTYTNIYPYFWGISSTAPTASGVASLISSGAANKVLASGAGTSPFGAVTVPFNTGVLVPQFLWVAIFDNYAAKDWWFVAVDNKGQIGIPDSLFNAPITQSVNSPESYWSGVNFKIYISAYKTLNDSMNLQISI
jgi:hypothetical protein